MPKSLVLFDIDGTLIEGSGEGIKAYADAVRDVLGLQIRAEGYETAGKTDRLILRELLAASGVSPAQGQEPMLLAQYLRKVTAQIRAAPGMMLPGVKGLLRRLSSQEDLCLGLATGNLEQAARLKLELHGLNGVFRTGGFADDGLYREQVVAAGIRKARQAHGTPFDRIVVVGDTPRDVDAARANRVASIVVATGPFSVAELEKCPADAIMEDLTDHEEFIRQLERLASTS
jgi:phosphoglycolate phosphatase-like HAD superfamily hydrolase